MGDVAFHVTKEILGEILKVDREGIMTVDDYAPTRNFIPEVTKLPNLSGVGVSKKFLEVTFVNKSTTS